MLLYTIHISIFSSFSSFKWNQIKLVAHTMKTRSLSRNHPPPQRISLSLYWYWLWIADIILLLWLLLLLRLAGNCNALLSQLVVALTVKWQIAIKPTTNKAALSNERTIRMIHSTTCSTFVHRKMGIWIISQF